jgi:chromosome segregation ATPase
MRSFQQRIRDLEAKLVTQLSDLGDRDSEIARLKRCVEEAERATSRKKSELTSARKMVAYQDAKIAKLLDQAMEAAQNDKRIEKLRIEKLKKTRTRPTVSIHSAFCYF